VPSLHSTGPLSNAAASPLGFATTARARDSSCISVAASRGGRGGKGARGRGGKGKKGKSRDEEGDDDMEITTYVSCPKCMADSFVLPEFLGEDGRSLRCASCGKAFNATVAKLRDINDVYSGKGDADAKQASFTEESFFEMFGDKKTLPPPE